jgi:hypothetical protein
MSCRLDLATQLGHDLSDDQPSPRQSPQSVPITRASRALRDADAFVGKVLELGRLHSA